MKFKLSDKTSRFAKRTLADFSEKMIVMLADMSLEEILSRKYAIYAIIQGQHFITILMTFMILWIIAGLQL